MGGARKGSEGELGEMVVLGLFLLLPEGIESALLTTDGVDPQVRRALCVQWGRLSLVVVMIGKKLD